MSFQVLHKSSNHSSVERPTRAVLPFAANWNGCSISADFEFLRRLQLTQADSLQLQQLCKNRRTYARVILARNPTVLLCLGIGLYTLFKYA